MLVSLAPHPPRKGGVANDPREPGYRGACLNPELFEWFGGFAALVREPAGEDRDLSEALLDGRIAFARKADLESGGSHKLHTAFFASISRREEDRLT
jgi:hypothetical protein